MPDIFNCMDLLLLPSLNEGLPRVALEAQAFGVHVIGSNRGGIPEAIEHNNSFDLNDDFVSAVTAKVCEILTGNQIAPELPNKFSWDNALLAEREIHVRLANQK